MACADVLDSRKVIGGGASELISDVPKTGAIRTPGADQRGMVKAGIRDVTLIINNFQSIFTNRLFE
jgi:hypothetical protein